MNIVMFKQNNIFKSFVLFSFTVIRNIVYNIFNLILNSFSHSNTINIKLVAKNNDCLF